MIDKYKAAILEHEACRVKIVDLTKAIGLVGGFNCENMQGEGVFNITHCIERLWSSNKDYKTAVECGEIDELPDDEERGLEDLCVRCEELDKIINLRKEARKKYGIAKRRIGQIARGLQRQPITKGKRND